MKNGFWRDRPVFITGATGLVGGWLTKHLLEQGASVTALVRDWVPASEFVHRGLADRVNVVRGDLSSSYLLERALGEYEIEIVSISPPRRRCKSPTAIRFQLSKATYAERGIFWRLAGVRRW